MTLTIDQALLQAIEAHQTGRSADAEQLYRAILQVQPTHVDANHNLGVLAVSLGKPVEALPHLKAALETRPDEGQFWISYVGALIDTGQRSEARTLLDEGRRRGLSGEPVEHLDKRLDAPSEPSGQEVADLHSAYQAEDFERAEMLARALTAKFPTHDFGWKVLGAVLSVSGRFQESLAPMREALRLRPADVETSKNLAVSLLRLRKSLEAEAVCRDALDLAPDYAEAHLSLGNALVDQDRAAEAEASYREAVRIVPDYAEAFTNLGGALKRLGRLTEAEAISREAIRLKPDDPIAHNNLGDVLKNMGRLTDAETFYRKAIHLRPDYFDAHSNLLLHLNFIEALPPEAALAEAKRYGSAVSAKAEPKFTTWRADPDPGRLRVGFVSGDLNRHPVGYFIEGLIRNLDPDRFRLLAFPTAPKADGLTERIRPLFEEWLPIFDKNDREAAAAIHERTPHVLVDLSGHTANNRLPVFSWRPAPVQVSWLGYFATTGLPEMDYLLGDPRMSPEGEAHPFTETIWNLPETWLCMTPPDQTVPIAASPALTNGFVTFGCLGNLSKMNDEVVRLWAAILRRVPNSKLFLKARQLAEAAMINDVRARFAGQGVSDDRLILEGPSPRTTYFETYNRIDIVLDTFPYPGGTTSVDALWMGVPVLTLKGGRFLSRLGASIAHTAGQFDWIARDQDDYVEKAVAFAADLQGLARGRSRLREQVLQTPLFDAPRFARAFGDALWGMWRARSKTALSG